MIGDNNPVQYCEVSDEGIDNNGDVYPKHLMASIVRSSLGSAPLRCDSTD